MTNNFTSNQTGIYDWFSVPVATDSTLQASRAVRDFRNFVSQPQQIINPQTGKPWPGVVGVHMLIQNLNGGLNRVRGIARSSPIMWPYTDLDRMASGNTDVTEPGVCTLSLQTNYQTRLATANPGLITGCNVFSRGVIGAGGAANQALLKETSVTDPTLIAITYTPGSQINYLSKHIIGGATRAENLFVHRAGAAIHVLSDIVTGGPTVYGTMHANTNPSFGAITVPLTAATPGVSSIMIYANNSLYLIASTAAVGDAPTTTLTNIPNGGYIVGMDKVGSRPDRVYIVLPNQDISSGGTMLGTPGSEVKGHLISVNLEGTDPQPVKIDGMEEGVYWAVIYNKTLVVSDGLRVVQVSDTQHDLKLVEQREALVTQSAGSVTSDVQFRVGGLAVGVGALYVLEVQKNLTTPTSSFTGLNRYQPDTGSWLPINTFQNPAASLGSVSGGNTLGLGFNYTSPGSLPVSDTTGNTFFCTVANGGGGGAGTVDVFSKYLPPFGYSAFWLNRQTLGAGATTGQKFDSPSVFTSPSLLIEGLEGVPFVIEGIEELGDVSSGGTAATIQFAFGTESGQNTWTFSNNVTWTFNDIDRLQKLKHAFPGNTDAMTRLKYQITMTRGSNQYMAPNALPFIVRLLFFTDGLIRAPYEVRGPEYFAQVYGQAA